MKFTKQKGLDPTSFEEIITDGEKFTADIFAGGKYYECKSWSGDLLERSNFTKQLTNYLHNDEIENLDDFGFYFDPDKWTPNKTQLNNALKANKDLFEVSEWSKYKRLFEFTDATVPSNNIESLIDFIMANRFDKLINP
jgi:hypothetical protein